MSLFQIWTTHNRPWSVREIIVFLIILSVCSFFIFRAVRRKRLKLQQGAAVLALILFLGVVFASTVFTRTPTVRRYERIPFWSWYEVIVNHSQDLLIENLLNMILLLPVGILLPMILDSRLRPSMVFLIGVVISAVIELSQLIFQRGLFEWDDMIHNGLGCMLVSAKYSSGFPTPLFSFIIVVERYLDYFTTIMEDRLWQVLAKPVFRWRNSSGLLMNAVRAA